jgi:hypothetical protein
MFMFTSRIPRALTITAALVISGAVTPGTSTESRGRTINPDANTAAQAELPAAAAQAEAALGKALAGTWVVTLNQPGFPQPQRHFTFNSDGGIVINDDLQVGPFVVEHFSIGQGNWIRTGVNTVAATIVGHRYDLQGSFLGSYKVRLHLELNPITPEWSATFRIDISLPNGQVIFTSGGTQEATRLEVEPL